MDQTQNFGLLLSKVLLFRQWANKANDIKTLVKLLSNFVCFWFEGESKSVVIGPSDTSRFTTVQRNVTAGIKIFTP